MLIDLGGAKPVNEVRFITTGGRYLQQFNIKSIAKKIIIEGCKTTNASEFKKIGESKGKLIHILERM